MKLLSYGDADAPCVGVLVPDEGAMAVHDVLLDGDPWRAGMRGLIEASDGNPLRLSTGRSAHGHVDDVRLLPPLVDPSKVIAAPVNYSDHQAEMNESIRIDGLGVFLKAPSSVIGNHGVVRLPYDDRRFDQEGELALILGRRARHVPAANAWSYIFGYTCLLDITMRGGEDRSTRKSFDTFTPMGPWLVTPDEVGDLDSLRLTCAVNDEQRQDASVGDLIWNVPALLAYASSVMTLVPGDVITTGTPAGVGPIRRGDTISVSITRIGTLSVSVDDVGARHSPTKGADRGPIPPPESTPVPIAISTTGVTR